MSDAILLFFQNLLLYMTGSVASAILTSILVGLGFGVVFKKVQFQYFLYYLVGVGIVYGAKFLFITMTGHSI